MKDKKVNRYPKLKEKFPSYTNISVIFEAIEQHFSDLFDLSLLEELALSNDRSELMDRPYYRLFEFCMDEIKSNVYTVNEVVEELAVIFNNKTNLRPFRNNLLDGLLFVADKNGLKGKQLGYLERLAAGIAKPAEALSFIDMLRFVQIFLDPPSVFNLAHLLVFSNPAVIFCSGNNILINLNRDSQSEPKWAAVHVTEDNVKIYCEAMLLETEKKQLEQWIKASKPQGKMPTIDYEGQTAEGGVSSGYLAIAWFKEKEIIKIYDGKFGDFGEGAQRLSLLSNFWSMREAFLYVLSDSMCGRMRFARNKLNNINVSQYHHKNYALEWNFFVSTSEEIIRQENLKKNTFCIAQSADGSLLYRLQDQDCQLIKQEDLKLELAEKGGEEFIKNLFDKDRKKSRSCYPKLLEIAAKKGHIPAKNSIGFFLGNELVYAADISLHYQYDLLKAGKEFFFFLDSQRDVEKIGSKQEEALCLSQVNVLAQNRDSLDKNDQLKLVGNKLHFKLLENLAEFGYGFPYGNAPNAFFLAVFNDAAARCSDFIISAYPQFQLTEIECQYIRGEMEYNAFIQNWVIEGEHNQSLTNLQAELTPFLARNRWLAFNHYKPPVMGDHWQAAARAWLKYLYQQHPNVLSDHENYCLFKRVVTEMGQIGLAKLLNYLSARQSAIEALFGKIKPSFYLGVGDKSNCELLINYLSQSNAYFPFSQMSIGYKQDALEQLITLLNQLNQQEQFSQIQLINVPSDNQQTTEILISALLEQAFHQKWTTPIVIKNLPNNPVYYHLNNIILCNRRDTLGQAQVKAIEEVSKPEVISITKIFSETALSQADFEIDLGEDEGPWPLSRESTVQLQIQYQRQLQQQQQRQLERKHQITQPTKLRERALQDELVSYTNVNELLKPYYQSLQREFSHLEKTDLNLQKFFADIISAEPNINAPHAIHYMTQDAAKYLLRQYVMLKPPAPLGGRLSFGLNTDASGLSKGLFPHRNKDDDLVLCYDPEVDQAQQPTPLTLDLDFIPPLATAWQGDFRQFDREHYLKQKDITAVTEQDLRYMAAFAAFQPVEDHAAAILEFCKQHEKLTQEDLGKITKNWLVFDQAWRYAGLDSALTLLNREIPSVNAHAALILLLSDDASKQQFNELHLSDSESCALGQLFYRFGKISLSLLIKELHAVAQVFPAQFDQFKGAFLQPCQDMSVLFSPTAMQTLQALRSDLLTRDNPILLLIWWQLSELHAQAVGFERPEQLWQAFEYFVSEIKKEGVELNNLEPFQKLKPNNMIIWMDRVLDCIRRIQSVNKKQSLFDEIYLYDLSHGGLPYALKEGIQLVNQELKLTKFEQGKPTYAPQLKDIFDWPEDGFALQIKRLLAMQSDLFNQSYENLCNYFINPNISTARSQLVCLSLIQHEADQLKVFWALTELARLNSGAVDAIAKCLHKAIYHDQLSKPAINLTALVEIHNTYSELLTKWQNIPQHLQIVWLEAATILQQRNALAELGALTELMQKPDICLENYPMHLQKSIYKLMALFGPPDINSYNLFIESTISMKLIARQTVDLLIEQVLSIDWQKTSSNWQKTSSKLTAEQLWQDLSYAVNFISNSFIFKGFNDERIKYIERLTQQGVVFKQSIIGDVRALTDQDRTQLDLSLFTDHELQLWKFLQTYIVIPTDKNAEQSLRPLLNLLKHLQLKRGEVNEIQQLLLALEDVIPTKIDKPIYWHVNCFYQLLQTLQPDSDRAPYPISLFKSLISNPFLAAQPIDQLSKELPKSLIVMIKNIAQAKELTRAQQKQLGELALREFVENKSFGLTQVVMDQLLKDDYKRLRDPIIQYLIVGNNLTQIQNLWEICEKLLTSIPADKKISRQWPKICNYWLKALNGSEIAQGLFISIIQVADETKKIQLLHIVAFSTLRQGLKTNEVQQDQLVRKAAKLVKQLQELNPEQLSQLAHYYPTDPAPNAEDLLRIIKTAKHPKGSIISGLQAFERNPHAVLPVDYGDISITRKADFQRLLDDMRITEVDESVRPLTPNEKNELTIRFDILKQLESGTLKIQLEKGGEIAILDMTKEQLISTVNSLPKKDLTHQQIMLRWALYFRALGHVTEQYPHLGQQFSLIAADILPEVKSNFSLCSGFNHDEHLLKPLNSHLSSPPSSWTAAKSARNIFVLEPGEGKSHFNALRTLKHLAEGNKVHLHTAKRSLAKRDHDIYKKLFAYFDISSAYLTLNSKPNILKKFQVIYTKTSDFFLFVDNQAYEGSPVDIDPNCVGIFDEVDFIRFDEGLSTGYIFSVPDSKTPEQMIWFYQVLNKFCDKNQQKLTKEHGVHLEDLRALVADLVLAAGQNARKQKYIAELVKKPLLLVRWVQDSYSRTMKQVNKNFYISSKEIIINKEPYLLRKLVPISLDNQAEVDSTFVGGEQQLLAEHYNSQEMQGNERKNFYLPPLSHVLSAQIANVCIPRWYQTWEGTTGTLSAQQADILQANVFRMPTNQPSLRKIADIKFFDNYEDYLAEITNCTQRCLQEQKSILFACGNDLSVKELHSQVTTRLGEKYSNQLLKLTNDSEESSKAILKRKKELEYSNQGKKQQGIGLFSSGLGRGDNPQVEVLMSLDVPRNKNDFKQEIARTARNGVKGTVYPLYRWSQVAKNYEKLTDGKTCKKFSELNQSERLDIFWEVLELGEKNTFLAYQAVQPYREVIDEYSYWGLLIVGSLPNGSEEKATFQQELMLSIKEIDQAWLTISADKKITTTQEKNAKIRDKTCELADKLYENYADFFVKATSKPDRFKFLNEYRPYTNNKLSLMPMSEFISQNTHKPKKQLSMETIKNYIVEEVQLAAFELLENAFIKVVDEETILKWLGQWERLARGKTKEEQSAFLMATLQVMRQCDTPKSIAAFEQLLNKTLAWWNKGGNKAYPQSLLALWHGLAKQSESEQARPLVDLITTFNLQQPGKLGFTWLSLFTDLSPELLATHWGFIQSIIPYLEKLPGKKSNKTFLVNKIIDVIKQNPQQLLSVNQIQQVIQKFLPDNALFLRHPEGMESIILSKLLLLPRRLPATEISPENLIALDGALIKFLQESKWQTLEIDSYLDVIDSLLVKSSDPYKLVAGLLDFQHQCCSDEFFKIVKYFDLLKYCKDLSFLSPFFVADRKLNQRFVEFFDFIEGFKLKDNDFFNVFALIYRRLDIPYPRELAEIYLICLEKKSTYFYQQIIGLKHFSQNQLIAIKNTCRKIDVQYLDWLFLDLKKLTSTSIDETTSYLEQLSLFYPMLVQLPEDDRVKIRISCAILDLARMRALFSLVLINQDKPYLIPHLLSFFPAEDQKGKQHEGELTINPNHSTLLARIFLLYENKQSQAQTEFRASNDLVNFVKRLNPFSEPSLLIIYKGLSAKNAAQIQFILSALGNLVLSVNHLENVADAINSIHDEKVQNIFIKNKHPELQYIEALTSCFSLLNNLENNEQRTEGINNCLRLQGKKLTAFLNFFCHASNHEIFVNYPQAIAHVAHIFNYIDFSFEFDDWSGKFSLQFVNSFARVFLLAANCLPKQNYEKKLKKLFELLLDLNESEWHSNYLLILSLLSFIKENLNNALQIVSDNFFSRHYYFLEERIFLEQNELEQNELEQKRHVYKKVSDKFYRLVSRERNDDNFNSWFDFDSKKTKDKRIVWMRLLLNKAFISRDILLNPWTEEENNLYLKKGFNAYVERAETIVRAPDEEAKNLLTVQKTNLLMLSDELRAAYDGAISSNILQVHQLTGDECVQELLIRTQIQLLIQNYKKEDKSIERITQFFHFIDGLDPLLESAKPINYQLLFNHIAKSREIAIHSDRILNACNWFFMPNGKGHSNYLNLLTEIESIVLKNWATLPYAIISFDKYESEFMLNLKVGVNSFVKENPQVFINDYFNDCVIPRRYTLVFVELERQLKSKSVPHLKVLAQPLAQEIDVYLNYVDRTTYTEEVALSKLFFQIHQVLDSYAAIGGKSSDRENDFNELKTALSQAMCSQDCYELLKEVIINARNRAVNSDKQHSQDFFPRHYGGDSRYMKVLHQLSDLVINYAEASCRWQDGTFKCEWIKNYLRDEWIQARDNFNDQLNTFYQDKKDSPFWNRIDLKEIEKLLNQCSLNFIDSENDEQDQQDDQIELLTQQTKKVLPLLPGYLQVLAKELIHVNKKLKSVDESNDEVNQEKKKTL